MVVCKSSSSRMTLSPVQADSRATKNTEVLCLVLRCRLGQMSMSSHRDIQTRGWLLLQNKNHKQIFRALTKKENIFVLKPVE